ncbi:hypothetical protein FOG48_02484 [Hanseniaspora uvarum]|nr:hypothetical protein FOG48_02484 [Hanseniaspora uvarum]
MISTVKYLKRQFSQASILSKAGSSLVHPTHHIERYKKNILSTTTDALKTHPNDIKSNHYFPLDLRQDRLQEHYYNSVQSDMLLMAYDHSETFTPGPVYREIDNLSNPYLINKTKKVVFGKTGEYLDRYPITPKNIPELLDIDVVCVAKDINVNKFNYISAQALLQQTTNVKPKHLKVKVVDQKLNLRIGSIIGGQVALNGYNKSQFLLTVNELVLPKDENFTGIQEHLVDTKGNFTLHLTSEHVSYFPEVMSDKDLWDKLFNIMININTTAQDPAHVKMLLSGLGFPFRTEKSLKEPKRV